MDKDLPQQEGSTGGHIPPQPPQPHCPDEKQPPGATCF